MGVCSFNVTESAAITPRTKIIIVNTPHNPVGKVFTRKELEMIAAIAEEFNLLVMSDEVVSWLISIITSRLMRPCFSTIAWFLMKTNMCELPHFQACGTVQLPLDQPEVCVLSPPCP